MCTRCNGLMVRACGVEAATKERPAFYCVNCGNIEDKQILENRYLSKEINRAGLDKRLLTNLLGEPTPVYSTTGWLHMDRHVLAASVKCKRKPRRVSKYM